MEQNQEVDGEIYFDKFEKNPANLVEIAKKLNANNSIWQFTQGYSAKMKIDNDKIAYLVPKKNAKII